MTDSGADPCQALAVVAAAGRARRFGADKRRVPLADGRPLITTTLDRARTFFDRVAVVIRIDDDPAELGLGDARVLRAPRADRGLGASIGDAFTALLASDDPASVAALWLGDMPWVSDATVQALLARAGATRIVRPLLDGVPGFPVLFGRAFWPELAARADGDGARDLIARHRESLIELPVSDPGVLRDVDRPGDLPHA
ncbi:NTP transferase domain-containing protein [Alloalcanivorax marinus]|uniref:NTP transferase domain-containing protein n=1 Tax=Alloalcanivorax marinus TaxID=1177169 RepID=UPI0019344F21|nr:NTP transferase domain-containing protein [Alloalcanivorax marinus]